MFNGESEEAIESWLLNIKRYFQVYRYDDNFESTLSNLSAERKSCPVVVGIQKYK